MAQWFGWVGTRLTREQRIRKIHCCAKRVLALDKAEPIVEMVEQLSHIEELMLLARG
jgi:hypothetical protein